MAKLEELEGQIAALTKKVDDLRRALDGITGRAPRTLRVEAVEVVDQKGRTRVFVGDEAAGKEFGYHDPGFYGVTLLAIDGSVKACLSSGMVDVDENLTGLIVWSDDDRSVQLGTNGRALDVRLNGEDVAASFAPPSDGASA